MMYEGSDIHLHKRSISWKSHKDQHFNILYMTVIFWSSLNIIFYLTTF